ncbi:hypothetical protein D3C79_1058060 [compost metagenome]
MKGLSFTSIKNHGEVLGLGTILVKRHRVSCTLWVIDSILCIDDAVAFQKAEAHDVDCRNAQGL